MAMNILILRPFGEEFTQNAPGLSGIVIPKPKSMVQMDVARSLLYFILAGFCEIAGGYLIWLWLREGKSTWFALSGAVVLIIYGIIATLQPANFGRVYAAYGGIFIILAILWGWQIDKIAPDRFDLIGGLIALIGASVIMYWPRS